MGDRAEAGIRRRALTRPMDKPKGEAAYTTPCSLGVLYYRRRTPSAVLSYDRRYGGAAYLCLVDGL